MILVTNNSPRFPSIFDGILTENKLDVPNYENFSIPFVNIQEKNTNFVIELAAPGLKKKNFTIELDGDVLHVSATSEEKEKDVNNFVVFTRKEFNFAAFNRSFALPDNLEAENITATYEAGVLTISLPKKEEQKALKKMVEIS
ncbi:MAG: hypothetical protein CMC08_02520 [Flavobacteriaceae bacterium]|nr:hypothetical protein [Flavobacteriaceae bacterium]